MRGGNYATFKGKIEMFFRCISVNAATKMGFNLTTFKVPLYILNQLACIIEVLESLDIPTANNKSRRYSVDESRSMKRQLMFTSDEEMMNFEQEWKLQLQEVTEQFEMLQLNGGDETTMVNENVLN